LLLLVHGSEPAACSNQQRLGDIAVIGGGPAGAAAAIRAARAGAKVVVFEKGKHGRDKVCGDGLTPGRSARSRSSRSTSTMPTASTGCA
jgi:thioredoxin reductase